MGFTLRAPQRTAVCHHCGGTINRDEVSVVLETYTHGRLTKLYIHPKCYLHLVPKVLKLTDLTDD